MRILDYRHLKQRRVTGQSAGLVILDQPGDDRTNSHQVSLWPRSWWSEDEIDVEDQGVAFGVLDAVSCSGGHCHFVTGVQVGDFTA